MWWVDVYATIITSKRSIKSNETVKCAMTTGTLRHGGLYADNDELFFALKIFLERRQKNECCFKKEIKKRKNEKKKNNEK